MTPTCSRCRAKPSMELLDICVKCHLDICRQSGRYEASPRRRTSGGWVIVYNPCPNQPERTSDATED